MLVLSVAVVSNPFVVNWSYRDENIPMTLAAVLPALPLLVFGGLAVWQERVGTPQRTFAAGPLASSMLMMSIWVVCIALLGYWGVLLGAVVLPAAAVLLAVAWVQPADGRLGLTIVLAIAVVPFVVWFAGRADEYLSEAVMSGCAIVSIIVALALIRRRGNRAPNSVSA
jgi:ABC-type uncharacterized transport system permease subunit